MARSCGLRIGPRRFELIVLDGSAKRHKITTYHAGVFPEPEEDETVEHAAAQALRAVVKEFNIPRESVGIAVDTGHAAFRQVTLPFSERSKIEQVIKFEVESELPQWNIDDVIVDFKVMGEGESSSHLLVSALPKPDLARTLDLCEDAHLEPLVAEFETTAMVNAAMAADMCNLDDAQLLVHVGEYATSVVVVDAGEIREMRVIHIGALSHEVGLEGSAPTEGDEEAGEESAESAVDAFELRRRLEQSVKRLRRELGVTISGARTIQPIDAVYVCGLELPGLIGSSVLDVPVYVLDCFEEDGGQPADGFGQLVVAYGAALRQLGGGRVEANLRREELSYTGAFERIEFPLAVTCLLLATLLGVLSILQTRERGDLENEGIRTWVLSTNNYLLSDPASGTPGKMDPPDEDLIRYKKMLAAGHDPDRTPLESMRYIDQTLAAKILALRRGMGQSGDVEQPQSAFVGMSLVLGVLESDPEKTSWRPSLRDIKSKYQSSSTRGSEDTVQVVLSATFFAKNTVEATSHIESFRSHLLEQAWCKDVKAIKTTPTADGLGVVGENITITLDVSKYFGEKSMAARAAGAQG